MTAVGHPFADELESQELATIDNTNQVWKYSFVWKNDQILIPSIYIVNSILFYSILFYSILSSIYIISPDISLSLDILHDILQRQF